MPKKLKISFTLDESDAAYFRNLYRKARRGASGLDPNEVVKQVRRLVERVRGTKRAPRVVIEAVETLEDLIEMIEDKDYALPKRVANDVTAALAYFANPADLVPDQIPGLGFLDDAIMIKLVEDEFEAELWGYRKFRGFRRGAEQRPWTRVAQERLPKRLAEERKRIRAQVEERKQKRQRGFSW